MRRKSVENLSWKSKFGADLLNEKWQESERRGGKKLKILRV